MLPHPDTAIMVARMIHRDRMQHLLASNRSMETGWSNLAIGVTSPRHVVARFRARDSSVLARGFAQSRYAVWRREGSALARQPTAGGDDMAGTS